MDGPQNRRRKHMELTYKRVDERFKPEPRDNGWVLYVLQKPNFGAKFRYLKPGSEMHLHSTQNMEEIIHILGGSCDIYVKPSNGEGEWIAAEPGTSIYLHNNTLHRLKAGGKGMAYLAVAIMGEFRWYDAK
jgi:oxalate decarboxylase/phosphoglucose isomerase-like protein (cupin superfamily)